MRYEKHRRGSAAALLFGGLVGAGLALMTAPASGRETRQRISDFAEDIKERAGCYIVKAKGKVTSAVDRGKALFEEKRSIVLKSFEAGREAFRREKERYAEEHKGEKAVS